MIQPSILPKFSLRVLVSLILIQQTIAASSSLEPSIVPFNSPVQPPAVKQVAAPAQAPMVPVAPPAKASDDASPDDAVPPVVKSPSPPAPPKQEPPSGFIVSAPATKCQMSKEGASKNSGADVVAGDDASDQSGKAGGSSGKGGDGSSGKGERANRYRHHQRRQAIKGDIKRRRELQPSPANATAKTPDAKGDGVKADVVGQDGCDESLTDELSANSGGFVEQQSTLLFTLMFFMAGCPFLLF